MAGRERRRVVATAWAMVAAAALAVEAAKATPMAEVKEMLTAAATAWEAATATPKVEAKETLMAVAATGVVVEEMATACLAVQCRACSPCSQRRCTCQWWWHLRDSTTRSRVWCTTVRRSRH
jgi:hypothetical protein